MTSELHTVRENLALIKARILCIQEDIAGNIRPYPEGFTNALTLVEDSARIIASIERADPSMGACKGASLGAAS